MGFSNFKVMGRAGGGGVLREVWEWWVGGVGGGVPGVLFAGILPVHDTDRYMRHFAFSGVIKYVAYKSGQLPLPPLTQSEE